MYVTHVAKMVGWIFRDLDTSKHVLSYMLLLQCNDETLKEMKFMFPPLESECIFVNTLTSRMWQK